MLHLTASWNCTVPCRLTGLANSHVSYHLVEGGQVKKSSPNSHWPEVRGLGTVTLCQDSRRRKQTRLWSAFQTFISTKGNKPKGGPATSLATRFAQGGSLHVAAVTAVPLTQGREFLSPIPSHWTYPATQKGWTQSGTCSMHWPSHSRLGCLLLWGVKDNRLSVLWVPTGLGQVSLEAGVPHRPSKDLHPCRCKDPDPLLSALGQIA